MEFIPPKRIKVVSDGNELALVDKLMKNSKDRKENYYLYTYEVSLTKMGRVLPISESELKKFIANKLFKVIYDT